jgi:hypothetical protein
MRSFENMRKSPKIPISTSNHPVTHPNFPKSQIPLKSLPCRRGQTEKESVHLADDNMAPAGDEGHIPF